MTITPSEDIRDVLTGLRNADAMENALSIMEPQAARLESYPEVRRWLEDDIRETHGQIKSGREARTAALGGAASMLFVGYWGSQPFTNQPS